jgi:hypothetical protein
VIEDEGRENQLLEPMLRPPRFRRCYGVSEKFSEVSEKSALRRHLCSPFVTDVFFALQTPGKKIVSAIIGVQSSRMLLRNFSIIDSNLGDHQNEKDPGIDDSRSGAAGDFAGRAGS